MDGIKGILSKRAKAAPNKRIHSPVHALADEISTAFGERKRFAMYLGVINRVGIQEARSIFSRLNQEAKVTDKGKLFMFLCRKAPTKPKTPEETTDPSPEAPNVLT